MPRDIGPARFSDIPGIVALGRRCLSRSIYAESAEVDDRMANAFLFNVIAEQKSGAPARLGSMAVFVTRNDGLVTGVIVGALQPLYLVLSRAVLTDLMWFSDRDTGRPGDGLGLLEALRDWALTSGLDVISEHVVTDAVEKPERVGYALLRSGFSACGAVYRKDLSE